MTRKLLVYFLTLLTLTFTFFTPTATALLRQHQESPGVMRYHSQTSIKDETGHAWQVILYKVNNPGASSDINLRLVGFPSIVKFEHPKALEVMTAHGLLLTAPDVYALGSPAPNVGEYKFTGVLNQLPTTKSLKLNLPLSGSDTQIKIPTNIITEWQMLVTEFD